ncbi:hypothetical protein [Blastopirellula retiformator]|uniref:Uncharacterized protein n=1 Tax=Blastopirellula retiformator TaxID=2527970 RepID=A0A5C5UYJ6_9BACT|nr:hypothetical protein [Blastopirellula retiformator]TWT30730.1 hypothetical protein Enr8_42530 [Blastopirellula retiformator]
MKFTTLIPLNRNDGSEVSQAEINEILAEIATRFGGFTSEGTVDGSWLDSGKIYSDRLLKVSVACDRSQYEEAKQVVIGIGRRTGQLAMFFEVVFFDGVQILEIVD